MSGENHREELPPLNLGIDVAESRADGADLAAVSRPSR
jgi:hypothetical protein